MIERFEDPDGLELRAALLAQRVVWNNQGVADAISAKIRLRPLAAGEVLITEGAEDNDVFLILSGAVNVRVKKRLMAQRHAGQHVGEMVALNPGSTRSATVVAECASVVAGISAQDFTAIANQHPSIWRAIASELASRLSERSKHVREPNPRPVVFIGSSSEGRAAAEALRDELTPSFPEVVVWWSGGVFKPSHGTAEDLVATMKQADFAVLVVTPDDLLTTRGRTLQAARDNVIFEVGLSMGALDRDRTLIVEQKVGRATAGLLRQLWRSIAGRGAPEFLLPSDLKGLTTIRFDLSDAGSLVGVGKTICDHIKTHGVK